MRVALVFSGQPRCVQGISYEGFRTCILERYDVDVYAHFWEDIEPQKSIGNASTNIEAFKATYAPKVVRVDPALRNDEYPLSFIQRHSPVPLGSNDIVGMTSSNYAHWIRNCISMYESMSRAYKLVKASGIEYDWIIRARTDGVLLRFPRLDALDPKYMYAPQWQPRDWRMITNIVLIAPPSVAPTLFSIRDTVETLPDVSDERFVFSHFAKADKIHQVRTLPLTMFYPTLTRDGVRVEPREHNLQSVIVEPPYSLFEWASGCWNDFTPA